MKNIPARRKRAQSTRRGSTDTQKAASELARTAMNLGEVVARFKS